MGGKLMLSYDEIQNIIPHRAPFLLIDRVDELEPGVFAKGVKMVSGNEFYFQGHFPAEKVMPGVLIIEALAQMGAVAILSLEENKGKIAYFGGINQAKFKKKVLPGDALELETRIVKSKGGIGIGQAIARVNGKIAVKAELVFAVGQ
jgi:3-hydroxyacyl-[acyl-carrier-protein] dehydratase